MTLLNLKVPLGGVATTRNAISAGRGVDAIKIGATGDFAGIVRELTALDEAHLDTALKSLSGEIHASVLRVTEIDAQAITDLVRNQLSDHEHESEDNPAYKNLGANLLMTYRREFGDDTTVADVNFAGRPDSQFEVQGVPVPVNTYTGLFGLTMRTFTGLEFTFEYETKQAKDESHHAVHFRMRFR